MADHSALDHLWAGWRHSYIEAVNEDDAVLAPDESGSLFDTPAPEAEAAAPAPASAPAAAAKDKGGAADPFAVAPADIAANQQAWIDEWTTLVLR